MVGLGPSGVFVEGGFVEMVVLVATGVFVGSAVAGMLVSNEAPGVRKTLIHAG